MTPKLRVEPTMTTDFWENYFVIPLMEMNFIKTQVD